MSGYCKFAPGKEFHDDYHRREYGFPQTEERVLMERLALEIMQAGLSWGLILQKREGFNRAFAGFDVDSLLGFGETDIERLLQDASIVRNRLKIEAIVHNARVIAAMRATHGGFAGWLAAHHPLTKAQWVKLFKRTFRFTGGEITGEFLMSLGYLPGSHASDCPVAQQLANLANPPAYLSQDSSFYLGTCP